jgi:hypothetical protein
MPVLVVLVCVMLAAAYLPSYLDQSFWSYGRCWPAVQRLRIWKVREGLPRGSPLYPPALACV